MTPHPYQSDVVLIGGGHSHVQVVKTLTMKRALPLVRFTMISDESVAYYSGMVPGCLAGLYRLDEIGMELRPLARWAGIRFIRARVSGIDPTLRQILFDDGRSPLNFDVLSINVGSVSRGMDITGVKSFATPTRPLSHLLKQVIRFESTYHPGKDPLRVVIAGGGAAGVELAFAMHARWTERFSPMEVTLVDSQDTILEGHHARVQKLTRTYLDHKNITYIANSRVVGVEEKKVLLIGGGILPFDLLLWATGGAPPPLNQHTGLDTDKDGFIKVKPTLQTLQYDHIFAAGDCINFEAFPLPKAGVYAVREGPLLAKNIEAFINKTRLIPYKPQSAILALLMTGTPNAIASWRSLALHGPRIWRLKDWIDRKWMKKFDPAYFPPMNNVDDHPQKESVTDKDAMRCAGCGAKVGSTILTGVLDGLSIPPDPHVKVGLQDADDAAILDLPSDRLLIQTIDGFRTFIDDLYTFGRISLIHAASDIFAMGGVPHSALIMVTLPFAAKHLVADDLKQLMTGVADEANRMNLTIIGGHTSEGSETSIGIMMNGLTDPQDISKKENLKVGDALVLTKPIGTGVILAADMRLKAQGRWMDGVIQGMLISNGRSAEVFKKYGITAVTDITGFGLAGHLTEMLETSGVSAEIKLEHIPVYTGTRACLDKGIQSTLAPSNREHIEKRWQIGTSPKDDILYDPQTSGGLLAGVRPDQLNIVLEALRETGYEQAACIGQVVDGPRTLKIS